jgi:hypothetical protein
MTTAKFAGCNGLRSVVPAALVLCIFLSALIPIKDYDFWWHLKTGEYILEHKGLPESDPFTYTFLERDPDMPHRAPVVLKSYWMSQVVFFLVYHWAGPGGIILLKALVFGLLLLLLWNYLREHSPSLLLSSFMLAGFVLFAKEFIAERPQIFSFLFAALVFCLLEGIREAWSDRRIEDWRTGAAARLLLLPAVMLVWANVHPGYPVGIAFILVYALALAMKRCPPRFKARLLVLYLISVCITLVNPVTYHPLTSLLAFQGSLLQGEAREWLSPFQQRLYLNANWYPYFALLFLAPAVMVIALIPVLRRKERSVLPAEHFLLLGGTAFVSVGSLRYGMFFMLVAVPILTVYLSRRFSLGVPEGFRRSALAALLILLLALTWSAPVFSGGLEPLRRPVNTPAKAAEFIRRSALPPNIYNDIEWGGYLLWELYPQYKVFSDTRTLNVEVYRQYLSILNAQERMFFGVPEWRALLDMYSVNTIVHSTINPYSGEIYPLMLKLAVDETWHLVYADGMAAVFVRKMSPGVRELPKGLLVEEMRQELLHGLQRAPGHPGFLRTLSLLRTQ